MTICKFPASCMVAIMAYHAALMVLGVPVAAIGFLDPAYLSNHSIRTSHHSSMPLQKRSDQPRIHKTSLKNAAKRHEKWLAQQRAAELAPTAPVTPLTKKEMDKKFQAKFTKHDNAYSRAKRDPLQNRANEKLDKWSRRASAVEYRNQAELQRIVDFYAERELKGDTPAIRSKAQRNKNHYATYLDGASGGSSSAGQTTGVDTSGQQAGGQGDQHGGYVYGSVPSSPQWDFGGGDPSQAWRPYEDPSWGPP